MKNVKILLCSIIFIFTCSLIAYANNDDVYIYEYPEFNLSIEFPADTTLSSTTRQMIADSIAYDIPLSQTYSWCWLLGHDTTTKTISAIYHKRSEYDPRCQVELYDVTSCSNCDYVSPVLISSSYISCCPPEASAISLD